MVFQQEGIESRGMMKDARNCEQINWVKCINLNEH